MRLRMVLHTFGFGIALLGLVACTSSIAGTATFAGPTETPAQSTEQTQESTEETEETEEDQPTGESEEILACITVLFAYDTANANFVELADATNNGTPTALTPEGVAADFDAAIAGVQPALDPLPTGAVRDAIQAAQIAAVGLRDGLRTGAAVNNTELNTALDSISTACDF